MFSLFDFSQDAFYELNLNDVETIDSLTVGQREQLNTWFKAAGISFDDTPEKSLAAVERELMKRGVDG